MSITYVGETDFIAQSLPAPTKNEFGVDTMTVKYRGAAYKLAAFLKSLRQGARNADDGRFYLQTWNADEGTAYVTVNLLYKGLLDGIPNQTASDSVSLQTMTVNCSTPKQATREMQFYAHETQYRYVTNTRPTNYRYSNPSILIAPKLITSTITVQKDDGTSQVLRGSAPIGLLTALTPAVVGINTGHTATPIIGTPYFECTDTCIYTYQPTA